MKKLNSVRIRRGWLLCLLLFVLSAQTALAASGYVYYGKRLSGFDKTAYNQLVKSVGSSMDRVDVEYSGSVSYRTNLAMAICQDYPRLFWLNGFSLYKVWKGGHTYLGYKPIEAWRGAFKKKSSFNKKVSQVVRRLKRKARSMNTAQRAKLAHDYVVQHCVYQTSSYDQTAYGVLIKGKAVCAGYAETFKLLCDELGVPCICVIGKVGYENHMVNFVRIGKRWYYVDTTWDDPGSGKAVRYRYFLLGQNSSRCTVTSNLGIKLPTLSAADFAIAR